MSTEIATDQAAPQQSVTDRIAAKFGLPSGTSQPEQTQTESGTQEATNSEPDLFELNFDGETFRVPSKLKDAFMRNDDYTRKTQEVAEQRRTLEQAREVAQQRQFESVFNESVAAETKELSIIDAYLQQASKVDWSQMNTEQMLRHKVEIDTIKERRELVKSAIEQKRSQFSEQVNAKLNELRGKSREIASKTIPGFSEQAETALRKFAEQEGLTGPEIDGALLDPRSFKLLWKAMQFEQVKAGTTKAITTIEQDWLNRVRVMVDDETQVRSVESDIAAKKRELSGEG